MTSLLDYLRIRAPGTIAMMEKDAVGPSAKARYARMCLDDFSKVAFKSTPAEVEVAKELEAARKP